MTAATCRPSAVVVGTIWKRVEANLPIRHPFGFICKAVTPQNNDRTGEILTLFSTSQMAGEF